MTRAVARYRSSRRYLLFALLAVLGTGGSLWASLRVGGVWPPATAIFGLSTGVILVCALRPVIEIHETHLSIGRRVIFWNEIARLDRTGWNAPLAVHLTLTDGQRILLLHSGDVDSSVSLLRHLLRYSRAALLDGLPYSQFWGESGDAKGQAYPQPRLLLPEDEEEVERLFQRLKAVGHLDHRGEDGGNGTDES